MLYLICEMTLHLKSTGITPEAKFSGSHLHFESIWTQMTLEAKFRESNLQFESMGIEVTESDKFKNQQCTLLLKEN
jgi:hypothetical protein